MFLRNIFSLNLDLDLRTEFTKHFYYRKGNIIYRKGPLDKFYRPYRKFKNSTRAKKFLKVFCLANGLEPVGRKRIEIYTSTR